MLGECCIRYKFALGLTCLFELQEEQYDHLDEAEVQKVDRMVNDVMIWMNSKMNQQSKQSLAVEPVVKTSEIQAKTRVRHSYIDFFSKVH